MKGARTSSVDRSNDLAPVAMRRRNLLCRDAPRAFGGSHKHDNFYAFREGWLGFVQGNEIVSLGDDIIIHERRESERDRELHDRIYSIFPFLAAEANYPTESKIRVDSCQPRWSSRVGLVVKHVSSCSYCSGQRSSPE